MHDSQCTRHTDSMIVSKANPPVAFPSLGSTSPFGFPIQVQLLQDFCLNLHNSLFCPQTTLLVSSFLNLIRSQMFLCCNVNVWFDQFHIFLFLLQNLMLFFLFVIFLLRRLCFRVFSSSSPWGKHKHILCKSKCLFWLEDSAFFHSGLSQSNLSWASGGVACSTRDDMHCNMAQHCYKYLFADNKGTSEISAANSQ